MEKKELYTGRSRSKDHSATINGLLTRRVVIFREALGYHKRLHEISKGVEAIDHIGYRKRLHEIGKDVEAIDRTLKMFDHEGDLDALMPRRVHDVIFKRGELAEMVYTRLRHAGRPLLTREIACLIILERGENVKDKKYVTKVTGRVYKKLVRLRKEGEVRVTHFSSSLCNKGKQRRELGAGAILAPVI